MDEEADRQRPDPVRLLKLKCAACDEPRGATGRGRDRSPAELVAGVLAISRRVTAGRWDSVAQPRNLENVARGLGLGPARFRDYRPGPLTGATSLRVRVDG